MAKTSLTALFGISAVALAACGGGGSNEPESAPATPVPTTQESCDALASGKVPALPDSTTAIVTSVYQAASAATSSAPATPAHCELAGTINKRVSAVNGQTYAIGYHMRLPETTQWNGRFYFMGGGGTNGNLGDALGTLGGKQTANALSLGYAVVSTDSGHSNSTNNVAAAGGTASFGVDPQARSDFYYNAYDKVTQLGKALVKHFYAKGPDRSYFVGCSEGGREGFLMSQKFPTYFDGIVSGDPVFRIKQSLSGPAAMRAFAAIAPGTASDGLPAINKTYSDADVQLVANAVAQACDATDGLVDGIVSNYKKCSPAVVYPKLDALTCSGAKTATCLTAGQISALKASQSAPTNAKGQPLYADWHWDPGFGGYNNGVFNNGWRSWWLGSFNSAANGATKLTLGTANLSMLWTTPPAVSTVAGFGPYMLAYDMSALDPNTAKMFPAGGIYTEAPGVVAPQDKTDLSEFKANGGKLIVYHGVADAATSFNDTATWYEAMDANMNGSADFARFYAIPGMNHCSGGPSTDQFDMLTPLVNWVEKGQAPTRIVATASTPGYFGVSSLTRPLCPYPQYARYSGNGDTNDAASFYCSDPNGGPQAAETNTQ
jgi:feruloyl esterase